MALKIKMVEIDGEKRVPPEVMDLLKRMQDHRSFCDQCQKYMTERIGDYCSIGREIILKLEEQPEVEFTFD
jgi:hypothetical protein